MRMNLSKKPDSNEKLHAGRKLQLFTAVLITGFFLLFFSFSTLRAEAAAGVWKKDAKGYWYEYADGSYAKSKWIRDGKKYYYLNSAGYMQTGWKTIGGKKYYLGKDGARRTGWKTVGGRSYYFGSRGAMCTGWKKIEDKRYYFGTNGVLRTGWKRIDGKKYFLGTDGAMRTGWVKAEGFWYYFGKNGVMRTLWQKIDGQTYLFRKDGTMLTGWKTLEGKTYFFKKDGAMSLEWQNISGKKYYFGKNGVLRTGWQTIDGKKYYLGTDGAAWKGWKTVDEKRYYFGTDGAMAVGWTDIGEDRYYFSEDGLKLTGWQTIEGKQYYLNEKGILSRDTMLGNRYVNQDGAWVYTYEETEYEVKDYFQQSICRVMGELNDLSSDWDSFIVVTDTHGKWNQQHSQNVVRYLLEKSPAKKCFLLGDFNVFGYQPTTPYYFEMYAKSLLPVKDQIYATIGNHDRDGMEDYDKSQVSVIYDYFLADKEGLKGDPEDFYFYFDDPDRKLRYLVLNTSNDPVNRANMTETELEWLQYDGLVLPGEDWTVMVLGHLDINPDIRFSKVSRDGVLLSHLIANCNGHVAGYMCGHEHKDHRSLVKDTFYQTIVTSDFIAIDQPERSVGTESEQAVTIVSINTKTGDVQFRRVGTDLGEQIQDYNYYDLP